MNHIILSMGGHGVVGIGRSTALLLGGC